MKINFTKREYRLLLDLVYLGQWMIEAHDFGVTEHSEKYDMVVQKIYSYAKEMDCADLVENAQDVQEYYPTRAHEEGVVRDFIEKYNDETFWEELINRLTERDVMVECTVKNIEIKSAEEFWELASPFEEKYAQEFEKNVLSTISIKGD